MDKRSQVRTIIHTSATAAASVGAGLAQIPGSDNAVIMPIQIAMIISIAEINGRELSGTAAASTLAAASAGFVGRSASQTLIGWFPGIGNAINAATAFAITESIGWAANEVLLQ